MKIELPSPTSSCKYDLIYRRMDDHRRPIPFATATGTRLWFENRDRVTIELSSIRCNKDQYQHLLKKPNSLKDDGRMTD